MATSISISTSADDDNDDYSAQKVLIATVFSLFFSILAVLLRYIARRMRLMCLNLEYHFIWIVLFFKISLDVAGIIMLQNGMGRHITIVSTEQFVISQRLTQYSGSYIYPLCITFVKLSILLQYRRLFALHSRSFLLPQIDLLMASTILWYISIIITAALICVPIYKLWTPATPGSCLNLASFYYALQIPNIVTDIIIIVLPFWEIMTLDLSRRMKLGANVMLLFGIITVVFDIVRLVVLVQLDEQGTDTTYIVVNGAIFTSLEPAAAIVTVCIPSVRSLYRNTASRADPFEVPSQPWSKTNSKKGKVLRWMRSPPITVTSTEIGLSLSSKRRSTGNWTSWVKAQTQSRTGGEDEEGKVHQTSDHSESVHTNFACELEKGVVPRNESPGEVLPASFRRG